MAVLLQGWDALDGNNCKYKYIAAAKMAFVLYYVYILLSKGSKKGLYNLIFFLTFSVFCELSCNGSSWCIKNLFHTLSIQLSIHFSNFWFDADVFFTEVFLIFSKKLNCYTQFHWSKLSNQIH